MRTTCETRFTVTARSVRRVSLSVTRPLEPTAVFASRVNESVRPRRSPGARPTRHGDALVHAVVGARSIRVPVALGLRASTIVSNPVPERSINGVSRRVASPLSRTRNVAYPGRYAGSGAASTLVRENTEPSGRLA